MRKHHFTRVGQATFQSEENLAKQMWIKYAKPLTEVQQQHNQKLLSNSKERRRRRRALSNGGIVT